MRERALGLQGGAALHRQHAAETRAAQNAHDAAPVDDAIAAGAAHGRACHFPLFGLGVFDGDVLGVHVNYPIDHGFEPRIGIFPAQECIAGVVVDLGSWRQIVGPHDVGKGVSFVVNHTRVDNGTIFKVFFVGILFNLEIPVWLGDLIIWRANLQSILDDAANLNVRQGKDDTIYLEFFCFEFHQIGWLGDEWDD